MQFLLENFSTGDKRFYHSWKNGQSKHNAFLEDHAFLIQALIHLQEITGNTDYLLKAKRLTEHVIEDFSEQETGFFFFTALNQTDVIIRKKEVYDGAMPSGNSIMFYNLHHLSILFDQEHWREMVEKILSSLGNAIIKYPTSFGNWACLLKEIIDGTQEIAIVGESSAELISQVLAEFIPQKIFMTTSAKTDNFPLLRGKLPANPPLIYLCKRYACQQPVASLDELRKLLKYQE